MIAWLFYGVVVERQLYEPCENEQQCNGTVNAGKCRSVANHSFCFCNDGLVEYQGRCVEGSFEFVSTKGYIYICTIFKIFSNYFDNFDFFHTIEENNFFFFFTVFIIPMLIK